jgi:hypothetical protein
MNPRSRVSLAHSHSIFLCCVPRGEVGRVVYVGGTV